MIGIISKDYQKPIVEEFFQLFKVPWEFYNGEKTYDVIITTNSTITAPPARLLIIFGSETTPFDIHHNLQYYLKSCGILLEHFNFQFPVYKDLSIFQSSTKPFIKVKDKDEIAGIEYVYSDRKILRIGYDLFDEIAFLLSQGQTVEYAQIPTIEIHISMLRNWILDSGLPLLEIPPIPYGYNFIVCLTHDVDFMYIRNHNFDRSVIGFLSRVILFRYLRDINSRFSWSKLFRNWKALLSLPGVYVGLIRDFWFDIDRYMEIEKEMGSTFFFIPLKNHPGDTKKNNPPRYRAARYDIHDYKVIIEDLIKKGHEIALHGIDAWHDSGKGIEELETIRTLSGNDSVGVRMHWLYFSEESPKALEEAGFLYDSTLGYNDAVGYKNGATQVFRLSGSSNVFELPLNVMDTTMFYPKRMGLSESKALQMCKRLISDMRAYGGVFTINWHTRSLSPERNWDDFYLELLKILKAENVWFATAGQAVNWFKKRRSFHFNDVNISQNKIQLELSSNNYKDLPNILLRFHYSKNDLLNIEDSSGYKKSFVDIPWSGEIDIEHTLKHTIAEANIRA